MTPDTLSADLLDHLYFWLDAIPALERRRSQWVMNGEWYTECRRLAMELGFRPSLTVGGPDILLGMPIEVRDGGGVPHLEVPS